MAATEKFKEMALSFYGCDGGNLDSSIWICGLEWGGGYENDQINESEFIALPLSSWDSGKESISNYFKNQYNQKTAWFFSYLLGWDINDFKSEAEKNYLFSSSGTGFKMNAFPISFKGRSSINWSEQTQKLTGFDSFEIYREWCVQKRGAFFCALIKKHSPKAVICTGITSAMEFIRFFGCDLDTCEYHEQYKFYVAQTNEEKTLVFVAPFFGHKKTDINSYEKMEALTMQLNKYASSYFNTQYWYK